MKNNNLKFLKGRVQFITENYMSDEDIASEFNGLSVEEVTFEARDMSYMFNSKIFKAYIVWAFPNGGEHVGGGAETTSEDFNYSVEDGIFEYVTDHWYPDSTYNQMVSMIAEKLKENYGRVFNHVRTNDFNAKYYN